LLLAKSLESKLTKRDSIGRTISNCSCAAEFSLADQRPIQSVSIFHPVSSKQPLAGAGNRSCKSCRRSRRPVGRSAKSWDPRASVLDAAPSTAPPRAAAEASPRTREGTLAPAHWTSGVGTLCPARWASGLAVSCPLPPSGSLSGSCTNSLRFIKGSTRKELVARIHRPAAERNSKRCSHCTYAPPGWRTGMFDSIQIQVDSLKGVSAFFSFPMKYCSPIVVELDAGRKKFREDDK
jgi:hypothetical protein